MAPIIGLALIVILAVVIFGAVLHLLFSPWILLAAVAVIAWVKFRPRRAAGQQPTARPVSRPWPAAAALGGAAR
jgi:hypothetical protein